MANSKNRKSTPADDRKLLAEIEDASEQLLEGEPADGDDEPVNAADAPPDDLTPERLRRAWTQHVQVRRAAERIKAREATLKEQERKNAKDRQAVAAAQAKQVEEDKRLTALELDAQHGFFQEREQMLKDVKADAESLRNEISELAQQRRDLEATVAERVATEREQAIAEDRETLDRERGELETAQAKLRGEQRALAMERADLNDTKAHLDAVIERAMGEERDGLNAQVASLQRQLDATSEERDRAERLVAENETAKRALDGRSAEAVAADLAQLREDNANLQADLESRPSAVDAVRLNVLQATNDDLTRQLVERESNAANVERLRLELVAQANEIQRTESHADALQSSIAAYEQAIVEQKELWDDLVDRETDRSPFPQLTAIDRDENFGVEPTFTRPDDLTTLARRIRLSMALPLSAEDAPPALYYSDKDVRLFLAGLASSRLHLLEGISGTGKTSLPLAFTAAVHGASTVVEVQAGWRDRQDLLGHYNTFERRYDETEFVQALYQAQTESQRDRLVVVVLDEMNLSHPEQYFADVLSALEQRQQQLTLTNAQLTSGLKHLVDGRILKIPKNVWFVGTANHDETTASFADKTYDRSHVQVLPYKRPDAPSAEEKASWEKEREELANPVSFTALREAFAVAQGKHGDLATKASNYLTDHLSDVLAKRFDVGWGNRLDTQLSWFVPVYVAAGGTMPEAVDHVLATRILRKVRDRHDVTTQHIDALQTALTSSWADAPWTTVRQEGGTAAKVLPVASNEILARERERLSGGF